MGLSLRSLIIPGKWTQVQLLTVVFLFLNLLVSLKNSLLLCPLKGFIFFSPDFVKESECFLCPNEGESHHRLKSSPANSKMLMSLVLAQPVSAAFSLHCSLQLLQALQENWLKTCVIQIVFVMSSTSHSHLAV